MTDAQDVAEYLWCGPPDVVCSKDSGELTAMRYVDCEKVAQEAGIPRRKLAELRRFMQREFPDDELKRELHLLRACVAIRDGHIRIEDALRLKVITDDLEHDARKSRGSDGKRSS